MNTRIAKRMIGRIAASPAIRPVATNVLKKKINVIYYHFIGSRTSYYDAFYSGCTLDKFRKDMKLLARNFTFRPLEDVLFARNRDQRRPEIALTFDDGFSRCRDDAILQILDDFKIKATIFLITDCIDNKTLMWRNMLSAICAVEPAERLVKVYNATATENQQPLVSHGKQILSASMRWNMHDKDRLAGDLWARCDLPPLREYLDEHRPYLTLADIHEWIGMGHSIGLHTRSHPRCSMLDEQQVETEIVQPAAEIRSRFPMTFLPFSYPFGDRLPAILEKNLFDRDIVDCAFGIDGFSPVGTSPFALGRSAAEAVGTKWAVYGDAISRPLATRFSG